MLKLHKKMVTQVVQKAVGAVFARVLEDVGVFKRDARRARRIYTLLLKLCRKGQ